MDGKSSTPGGHLSLCMQLDIGAVYKKTDHTFSDHVIILVHT